MGKHVRWICIAASGLLVAATQASAPQKGPTATLTFNKGYDKGVGFGAVTIQEYYLLKGTSCKRRQRVALLAWLTGSSATKPVPAGTPADIYAAVRRSNAFDDGVCQNNVIFTPLAGHRYSVTQRTAVWSSCKIEVIDLADNAPPPDLQQDNSLECIETVKPKAKSP